MFGFKRSFLVETRQNDVAGFIVYFSIERHRFDFYFVQNDLGRVGFALANVFDVDFGVFGSPEKLGGIVLEIRQEHVAYLDYFVPGFEPGFVGRKIFIRFLDDYFVVFPGNHRTNSGVFARVVDFEFDNILLVEIHSVGIQTGQHSLDGLVHQIARIGFVHIILVQFLEKGRENFYLLGNFKKIVFETNAYKQKCRSNNGNYVFFLERRSHDGLYFRALK